MLLTQDFLEPIRCRLHLVFLLACRQHGLPCSSRLTHTRATRISVSRERLSSAKDFPEPIRYRLDLVFLQESYVQPYRVRVFGVSHGCDWRVAVSQGFQD